MHKPLMFLCAIFGFGLGILPVQSFAESTSTFSATAVQTLPNGAAQKGKIFVSGYDTRFEFTEHGRDIIQIILPKQKIMRILFPKDKVFMEVGAPDNSPIAMNNNKAPCPPVDAMICKKLGTDKFGKLVVERWSQSVKGVKGEATLWWEPLRKMIVRQEYPDGRIMQLKLTDNKLLNGRELEHWTIAIAQPGKKTLSGFRLLDMALGIVVKEQYPNGLIRELKNLKVIKADPEWFAVPANFQRVHPPKPTNIPKQK